MSLVRNESGEWCVYEESKLNVEETNWGSVKCFEELGDTLGRWVPLLQQSETSSSITESMTDVLKRVSIALYALKLNIRKRPRQSKVTDLLTHCSICTRGL